MGTTEPRVRKTRTKQPNEQPAHEKPVLPSTRTLLPTEDRAYALHLRGHSLRAIAARLGIDKDTAHRYVRSVADELAPIHQEQREELRQEAIARLRAIAAAAGDRFEEWPEPALLNTMTNCEREIARLEGLYDQSLEIAAAAGEGLRITVSYVNDWRGREKSESGDTVSADAEP